MKRAKSSITIFNLPSEWLWQISLPSVQIAVLVLFGIFVKNRDWTFWLILVVLCVSILYFGSSAVYKIYRSQLTTVTIDKERVIFRRAFRKICIGGDEFAVALADRSKNGKKLYAVAYGAAGPESGFVFVVSTGKTFKKLAPYSPPPLLAFLAASTETPALESELVTAPPDIAECITRELDKRNAPPPEPPSPSNKRKRKRKKHKKKQ